MEICMNQIGMVKMMKVMTIDPGDHIGLLYVDVCGIHGATLDGEYRLIKFWKYIDMVHPDVVVYERFALRADKAKKLVGNTFATCEVIGLIKLYCQLNNIEPVELIPADKEYCGFSSNPKDPHYQCIKFNHGEKITEHVRDAYRLYSYYKLFKEKQK